LVWNVCRRVLRDEASAEDAFQAVFLTLVRKAHTIGRRASVASWLHKVAYRVAVEVRRQAARRSAREVPIVEQPLARPGDEAWREIRPVLDEEVCRLPEKYRAPVVLCYLQGRTNVEAARELGCPSGTVVTRLAWARRRLRKRLTQRGLSASAGLFAAGLAGRAEAAAVPARLIDAAVHATFRLASGATLPAGARAALQLSRAATRIVSAAHVKFAVVAVASVALAGGAALHGRGTREPTMLAGVSEAPLGGATTAPADSNETAEHAPEPADADEAPPQAAENPKNRLLAFFQRADVAKNTVTFTEDKGRAAKSRTLPLAADASITVNMKPARLADLRPGCKLKLFLSEDGSRIIDIRVKDIAVGNLDGKKSR
jgi:RNA polymerase sigma-70 factor (ECF subfamily)